MKNQSQDTVYRFHHLGIPTERVHRNERYSEALGMFTADHEGNFRVQFHRFEPASPLHPLIKTLPHLALQVDDLQAAIAGKELLLGPYEPIAGFTVAIINDNGLPIELIETVFTPEEVWKKAQTQPDLNTTGLEPPIQEPIIKQENKTNSV